jgi:hypothetical protein
MSAQILRFPSRPDIFTTVRVIRDRDTRGWLVIAGEHGWTTATARTPSPKR